MIIETRFMQPYAKKCLESPEARSGLEDPPLETSERAWSCQHFDSGLLFEAIKFVVICYDNPRKLIVWVYVFNQI